MRAQKMAPSQELAYDFVSRDPMRAAVIVNEHLSCACSDRCPFCEFGYAIVHALGKAGLCIDCGRSLRLGESFECALCESQRPAA